MARDLFGYEIEEPPAPKVEPPVSNPSDPFALPDGNVQIGFSGGRTSGFMLHQLLQRNGALPERVEVIFSNTGREFDETLEFVAEVGHRWGVRIVWLEYRAGKPGFEQVGHNSASRAGEPFEALLRKRGMLPNVRARFCSTELKIRTAKRYLIAQGWRRWSAAVGIRADEAHRIRETPLRQRWRRWHPLADAGIGRRDVTEFWRRQPFDLRLPNANGRTPLGNCDGCFLKSERILARLARDFPLRHEWWERWEREFKPTTGTAHTWSKRYARADLRRAVESMPEWAFDDDADAFCGASDGECTG